MTDEAFKALCNTYGFAPSRALRELIDCAVGQAPPQRKPLTDEEALDIARTFGAQPWPPGSCVAFARAVERAHGIT